MLRLVCKRTFGQIKKKKCTREISKIAPTADFELAGSLDVTGFGTNQASATGEGIPPFPARNYAQTLIDL